MSSTKLSVAAAGGPSSIKVTTGTGCTWTATTSASFITVSTGSGVGGGNDTFVINVAQAPGADRAATVTVGGQTITVNQTGAGLNPDFNMRDPGSQTGTTNVCRLRGGSSNSPTTCTFGNLSWSTTSSVISNWAWTVQYTYDGQTKTASQNSGTLQDFQLREVCGLQGSTAAGATIPMTVTLTVTDQNGVTATGTSGQGIIPALSLIAYTCGS